MKNIDFLFLVDKANKELQKVVDYLKSVEYLEESTNLKLYDAFFTTETEQDTELFYDFCDFAFQELEELIQDETNTNYHNLTHYIGRTSSFYCLSDELYNNIHNLQPHEKIYNLYYDSYGWNNILLDFTADNKINIIELLKDIEQYDQDKHDTIKQLEYIISGEFLNDIKATFKDCIFLYDTIKSFKENQIEYFDDYKSNYLVID